MASSRAFRRLNMLSPRRPEGGSASGYCDWRTRAPSACAIRHAWLTQIIGQIHTVLRGVYGVRRMHGELTLGRGTGLGREAVEMLMRRAGLEGLSGRSRYRHVPNMLTAADLVDRPFERRARDQLSVTEVTDRPTRDGKIYCTVVLDVVSRRVVGWSIDASPMVALVPMRWGLPSVIHSQ